MFILHGLGSLLFLFLLGDVWADHLKHVALEDQAGSSLFSFDWTPNWGQNYLCWPELVKFSQSTWKSPVPFKPSLVWRMNKIIFTPFSHSPSHPDPVKGKPSKSWSYSKRRIPDGCWEECVRFQTSTILCLLVSWLQNRSVLFTGILITFLNRFSLRVLFLEMKWKLAGDHTQREKDTVTNKGTLTRKTARWHEA